MVYLINLCMMQSQISKQLCLFLPHLSWYNLTIEPNTIFYSKPPVLPDDDHIFEIEQAGTALLQESGFDHYETSAFAQADHHCLHNLNYWEFGDYIGIGAGAHGKITATDLSIIRYSKKRMPNSYRQAHDLKNDFIAEIREVSAHEIPFEFLLNALRLRKGFTKELFQARTGINIDCIKTSLLQAKEKGLLKETNNYFTPTTLGRRFLNELLQLFMP